VVPGQADVVNKCVVGGVEARGSVQRQGGEAGEYQGGEDTLSRVLKQRHDSA
jgi:hypothetical protein